MAVGQLGDSSRTSCALPIEIITSARWLKSIARPIRRSPANTYWFAFVVGHGREVALLQRRRPTQMMRNTSPREFLLVVPAVGLYTLA
jgi:hypothetical protein